MCIGIPMQVVELIGLQALVHGRGRAERVDARLVSPVAAGDWLLIFQGAAREKLDALRAAEINAALDLLEQGLAGNAAAQTDDPGFTLPSQMSAAELKALTQPTP